MKYVIGIDSGGTTTKAAAYDIDGNLLKETTAGFGNLLTDKNTGLANIRETVERIISDLGQENCDMIVLGSAGIDSGNFSDILRKELTVYSTEIVLLNDAWMAHHALLQGKDGCLVIAGTGSICIGRYKGEMYRVGGWGNLLGDEGSGYDIARKAIKKILVAYDHGQAYSSLEQKMMKQNAFDTPFELVKFVYSSGKDKVADLAKIVSKEAEAGDAEAVKLLKDAGKVLAEQTSLLIKRMKMEPRIAVTGSVLLKNDCVYETFEQEIRGRFSRAEFVRKDISNTIGAYYVYMQKEINEVKG